MQALLVITAHILANITKGYMVFTTGSILMLEDGKAGGHLKFPVILVMLVTIIGSLSVSVLGLRLKP